MQTVWITGGSRGIGAATVREFARAGWRTAFSWRTSEAEAQALTQALTKEGCAVLAVRADMRDRGEVEACAKAVRAAFGRIDALVCNAGAAQQKLFQDITDADWDLMFDSNLRSAFYAVQAALPDFFAVQKGAVVTVSSVWGVTGASCESHYAASKAALIGLTKSLAQELGPSGIRANCVAPGVIDTDMNRVHSPETLRALAGETPLCRIGTPEETAKAIRFLASDEASFVTGQVLGVTGGFGA